MGSKKCFRYKGMQMTIKIAQMSKTLRTLVKRRPRINRHRFFGSPTKIVRRIGLHIFAKTNMFRYRVDRNRDERDQQSELARS